MTNRYILHMMKIVKTFPGVLALDGVDFRLRVGEVHVLLGENGAGKSTLIKILSGAYQKTEGRIILDGKEITIKNPRHAQILGISTIYQELNLVPHLTVGDNIFLGREPCLAPGIIDRNRIRVESQRILEKLGVKIDARSPVHTLGIAQKQMVEVAKALSMDARILIMDEPTSGLDPLGARMVKDMLLELKRDGTTILLCSHLLSEVETVCDHIAILEHGKLLKSGSVKKLLTRPDMLSILLELASPQDGEKYRKALEQAGANVVRLSHPSMTLEELFIQIIGRRDSVSTDAEADK